MHTNELTIKPYKDIKCKPFIFTLEPWNNGKLITMDGWGQFSSFDITGKDKIKVTPLVKFPKKKIDGLIETYPEADIIWSSSFQAIQFFSDIKSNRNVETVPIHSSYLHSHTPYLLDAEKKLFLIPYTGYGELYTFVIYDFINDIVLYNPLDNENDVFKKNIRFNFGNGIFLCKEQDKNNQLSKFCMYDYYKNEYTQNKLTEFLSLLGDTFTIQKFSNERKIILSSYDYEHIYIEYDENFSEIEKTPLYLPLFSNKQNNNIVSTFCKINETNNWGIGQSYGYKGFSGELLKKYYFMNINKNNLIHSIPVVTEDFYKKNPNGQFFEHAVYGTCYIEKVKINEEDYIRIYRMSDVEKIVENYLKEKLGDISKTQKDMQP